MWRVIPLNFYSAVGTKDGTAVRVKTSRGNLRNRSSSIQDRLLLPGE